MKLDVRPALVSDLHALTPREPNAVPQTLFPLGASLGGEAFAISHDGTLIAVLGLWEWMPGVGLGWGVLSTSATLQEVAYLTSGVRHYLKTRGLRRIEATVREDFPGGIRWLEHLDFQPEGRMECFDTDGAAHLRYALVMRENV